jgi:hypothetical protein
MLRKLERQSKDFTMLSETIHRRINLVLNEEIVVKLIHAELYLQNLRRQLTTTSQISVLFSPNFNQ